MNGIVLSNRYKLISELGSGGMAWVYLAEDLSEGQRVAVKILYPQLSEDMGFLQRFAQEAKLVMSLSQSLAEMRVARVLDYGSDRDTRYLVMEYVEGRDLRRVLSEEGALPWQKAMDIAKQIAQTLEHAYHHGIVHRDIKPANIMLLPDGTIRILDFGIARARTSPTLTHSGFVGSPYYIAPEQAMSRRVDIRADLYSLGVVLYEMLTGDRPFDSDTPWVVINNHIATPPPPLEEVRPDLPASVARLLRKSMSKRPTDRFQTPLDMARAIDQILAGKDPSTDSTDTEPDALAAFLDGLYQQAEQAVANKEWREAVDLFSQILRLDPRHRDVTEQLAEAGRQARFAALYDAARLSIKAGYWDDALALLDEVARFAPGYRDIQALRTRAEQGHLGQQAGIQDAPPPEAEEWAVVMQAFDQAFRPVPDRARRAQPSPPRRSQQAQSQSSHRSVPPQPKHISRRLLWSGIAALILFLALMSYVLPQIWRSPAVDALFFTPTPTAGASPTSVPVALATASPSSATAGSLPIPPTSHIPSTETAMPAPSPTLSPGPRPTRTAASDRSPTPHPPTAPPPTPPNTPTTPPTTSSGAARPTAPRLTGQIAFPLFDPVRATYDVHICRVDGSDCKRVAAEASQPDLLPDGAQLVARSWKGDEKGLILQSISGQRIWHITDRIEAARAGVDAQGSSYVYHSRQEADRLPYLYRTDGTQIRPILHEASPVRGQSPTWLPDGQILYSGCVKADCGIIAIQVDGTHPHQVVAGTTETNPEASPDGRQIAFMSRRDGNWEIYVTDLDGSNLRRLTQNATNDGLPTWSPDGAYIAFVSDRDEGWAVWVMRPDGSGQRRLFPLGGALDGLVRDAAAHEIHGWVEERISWSPQP